METILIILEETPWWVYLVLVYLLIVGFRASQRRRILFKKVLALPIVLIAWSLYNLHERWQGEWIDVGYWILFLVIGSFLGWWSVYRWKIHVDRDHGTLSLPGTWSTLILALSIFIIRYGFGFYYAIHPVISRPVFIADLLISGVITGLFIGRALNFWYRYQND